MMFGTLKLIFIVTIISVFGLAGIVAIADPATASVYVKTAFWILACLTVWSVSSFVFALMSAVFDKHSDTSLKGFGVAHGKNLSASLRRGLEVAILAGTALVLRRADQPVLKFTVYLAGVMLALEIGLLAVRWGRKR